MSLLSIPQMVSAGSLTFTLNSRSVTGDATTLANVDQGMEIFVPGYDDIFTAAQDAVNVSGNGDLEMVEIWPNATATVTSYVFNEALEENVKAILSEVGDTGAVGLYSGRSAHNAEAAGFLYLSTDGAGSSTDPILYQRVTSTSGVWKPVYDAADVDDSEADNPAFNPQGYVTDPYIDSGAKVDLDPLQHVPYYLLSETDSVEEEDADSDVTMSRGLKLTKITNAGRYGFCQIYTKTDHPHMFDIPLTVSGKVRLSAGGDFRIAIVSDTVTDEEPKDLVSSWPSTTYTPANFFVSTDTLTVNGVGEVKTAAGETSDFALETTTSVVGTQGRIFLFGWTEASQSAAATLEFDEIAIKVGGGIPATFKPQPVEPTKNVVKQSVPATGFMGRNKIINPTGRPLANQNLFGIVNATDRTMGPFFPWYVLTSTGTALTTYGADLTDTDMPSFFGLRADATQKIALVQKIGVSLLSGSTLPDVIDMFGHPLVFSFKARANVNMDIRFAFVRVAKSVSTTWNHDIVNNWASTSYTSGGFFITSTVDFVGAASLIADESQEVVGYVPQLSGTNSEMYAIVWTEDDVAANNTLYIGNVQIEVGIEKTPFANSFVIEEQWRSKLVQPEYLVSIANLSGASVDIVEDQPGLWATYRELHLTISGLSIDTATRGWGVRISTNSGSSFITSGYAAIGVVSGVGTSSDAYLAQHSSIGAATNTISIKLVIQGHQGGTNVSCNGSAREAGGGNVYGHIGHYTAGTSAVNALRVLVVGGSGSFDAGTYSLVGVR